MILRSRSIYQTALERGRSAEESSDRAAAQEIARLWEHLDGQIWGQEIAHASTEGAAGQA